MSYAARRVALLVAAVAMLTYIATHLRIGTDITNFMPDGGGAKLASLSRKLANSELTRTMIISIGADDAALADDAAAELEAALAAHPEVAWTRSALPADAFEAAQETYFARRYQFASDRPETEIPAMLSDASLQDRAQRLLRELRQPTSTFFKPLAMRDPLGLFRDFIDDLRRGQPQPPTRNGRLVSPDGRYALILLAIHHSPFDSGSQVDFLADLSAEVAKLQQRHGGALEIEMSGANRIAVRAEESIKRDVFGIVAFTFVGTGLLFLLFFRSPVPFVLGIIPAIFGMMAGVCAGIVLLGNLDGLSIAFGAALLGVAVDYSIHVIIHNSLMADRSPAETVRRLAPALILGALTTMASFAGLLMTNARAFRELGVVSIVGIGASILATMFALPAFLTARRDLPELSRRVATALQHGVDSLAARRRALLAFTIAVAACGLLALPRLTWIDDMSQLGNADPELIREEVRVRSRMPLFEGGRFVIVLAPTDEEALRRNDVVFERLQALAANGAIEGVRSLHQFVWSADLQRRNIEALQNAQPRQNVDRVFHAAGFRSGAFDTAFDDLDAPPPPLTLDDLRATPLGDLLSSMVLHVGDETAIVTHLRGIDSLAAVRAAIADLDGVVVFEQKEFVNEVYAEFRATTLSQIVIGSILVALVLLVHYRAWRPALASILPSLLVVVVLLGAFAAFGVQTNLLHAISLMMVMGMGVDYGIFLVDTYGDREAFASTMLSLLLSCLTTVFVFGALAISEHPALRAIGITTGGGVLLAFIFAPVSLLLTDARKAG